MIDFAKVERIVYTLKAQFNEGQLDQKSFEDHLLELVDLAPDGYYWMFGHESEQWFRYNGKAWVPDTPQVKTLTGADVSPEEGAGAGWRAINLGWFITSIIIIVAIAGIVYSSV